MRVIACFASSLDGKITPGTGDAKSRFGSAADLEHLKAVRDQADAILMGSGTFRGWPREHTGLSNKTFLHAILSEGFNIPPDAPLFKAEQPVPTVVFSPEAPTTETQARYPAHVQWQTTGREDIPRAIINALQGMGVKTLLVEGGGQVLDLFLQSHAVDELYLTLCPFLFGDQDVTSLVSGHGYTLAQATRAEILSLKQVENEIFLHLALRYP